MMLPRRVFPLLSLCLLGSLSLVAQSEPTILERMKSAADWQLSHPEVDKKNPADGWVYGAFYTGLSALAQTPGGESYHAACVQIGEANGWKLAKRTYHADDECVGQLYLETYLKDKQPKMIAETTERLDYVLAHPSPAQLVFDRKNNPNYLDRWSWCDALFMAPPTWVRLTAATGNPAYTDFALKQWWVTTGYLYDKTEHLFFRDSTYFAKREANGQKVFWSRGNGWVIAGLARVLEFLPADNPDRPKLEGLFRELAARLKQIQQPDGFWHSSLLDPKDFPSPEESGTGFIAFGLAYGVNHKILPKAEFQPAVDRAWAALLSCQEPSGRINHVQPIGAAPATLDPTTTVPYGVGGFLLTGCELIAGGAK